MMTTREIANYTLALQLDDDKPDHICPGCGQDLTGRKRGELHMTPEQWDQHVKRYGRVNGTVVPWRGASYSTTPFVQNNGGRFDNRCEWDQDMLAARAHRRRIIARYRANGSTVAQ